MGLKETLAGLEKQYGKTAVMKLGDTTSLDVDVISTGILPLDLATGVGGIPRGRIIEVYGPESGGKTTLTLCLMAEAQRMGGTVAFVDSEHALDPSWARTLGVDVDAIYISQPDSGEQALEIAAALIDSGEIDVLAVDSVAALVPRSELEGQFGDAQMGAQARLMSQAMRKLNAVVSRTKTVLLFTNQIREKIGTMYGNPEVTTGGRALKFYASLRIDLRQISSDEIKKEEGARIRARVVKNKLAAPFRVAEFNLIYGKGFDRDDGALTSGVSAGVLERRGSHYSWKEMKLGKSREEAIQFLRDNPEIREKIEIAARKTLRPEKAG